MKTITFNKSLFIKLQKCAAIKNTGVASLAMIAALSTLMVSCATDQSAPGAEGPDIEQVGKAAYRKQPLRRDNPVPEAPYRTQAMKQQAVPTNQWYSSVMYTQWSEVIHATPITLKASKDGFEMGAPKKKIVPTERRDVEVFYPHAADLVFSATAFQPQAANLAGIGDWNAFVSMDAGAESFVANLAHGSPFVYFNLTSGDMNLSVGKGLEASVDDTDKRILVVAGKDTNYAVFAPTGGVWSSTASASKTVPSQPTFGNDSTLVFYDGRLNSQLSWKSYNPDGVLKVNDSEGDSVFFEDREDKESKHLNISKKGENGNVYMVFGQPDSGERADLSYWKDQGEMVFDIRVNSAEADAGFLVKIDSGWPNVSDHDVPLPTKGEWGTVRIPVRDVINGGNRFNPGAFVDISKVENVVVLEPTGIMNVDIDNFRFEINTDLSVQSAGNWTLQLPEGKGYISAATLPDATANTIRTFSNSAYTHITNTKVDWQFDRKNSSVTSTFTAEYNNVEGGSAKPIIGLYPHHYFANNQLPKDEIDSLPSIRGPIRLFHTDTFSAHQKYTGFVPYWPVSQNQDHRKKVEKQFSRDASRARAMIIEIGWGAYWQGKGLQRISQLMHTAHALDEQDDKERLLELLQERMDEWFSTKDANWYFHYNPAIGTLVAYPEEYDAVKNLNDHHFHYGYWIRAAAEIAMQDSAWAQPENYGAMIDLLVSDIATAERGRKDFPFLRNYDPYESHSWAGGTSMDPNGNNQESSSEAINAWAALILWGEATGNKDLVDLGVFLYTSEINATNHYWFDLEGITLPDEYLSNDVSIVFGGRLAHTAWWTDEPRQIHGINLLPLTPSSTYLAKRPAFINQRLAAMEQEMQVYADRGKAAKPADIWQDIFAQYQALANPKAGLESWDAYGSFELGDTRTHALHWMTSLNDFGVPDLAVTADTVLYAVFKKANGEKTYMTYNQEGTAIDVTFSDGTVVSAKPNQLTVKTGGK